MIMFILLFSSTGQCLSLGPLQSILFYVIQVNSFSFIFFVYLIVLSYILFYLFFRQDYLKDFDFTVGFSKNWTLFTPDFIPPHYYFNRLSDEEQAQRATWRAANAAPIVAFISQCRTPNHRLAYLEELMKYIAVDSYGKCLHNKDLNEEGKRQKESQGKTVIMSSIFSFFFTRIKYETKILSKSIGFAALQIHHCF